jgi:2-dehydropantoate 2-reductase
LEKSILILGTGALATLFAAHFSAANIDVTLLGTWSEAIATLNSQGASMVDEEGVIHTYPVRAINDPLACIGARYALVLVKSWQTERAAVQLARCLAQDGLTVTLQNGLGNRECLINTLGLPRVAMGVTTTGATMLRPGVVRVGGEGNVTLEAHPRLYPLEDMFRASGFAMDVVKDVRSLVWRKLIVNAAINPLTALLGVSNGQLLETRETREMMAALAQETASVAAAMGIALQGSDVVRIVQEVAQKTASNHSSMLQDIQRGAQTEIDSICGAIVKAGGKYDLPVPYNWMMWKLVRAMQGG